MAPDCVGWVEQVAVKSIYRAQVDWLIAVEKVSIVLGDVSHAAAWCLLRATPSTKVYTHSAIYITSTKAHGKFRCQAPELNNVE